MTKQTQAVRGWKKWLLFTVVFLSGFVATVSGIYFLFMPSGGYQGGRNPMYGLTILFSRHTWEAQHTWGGMLMIVVAVVHFAIHWRWVKAISKRTAGALLSKENRLPKGVRLNVATNLAIAVSFLLTAVSGVYLFLAPSGGFQGGRNAGWDPMFLFSRTTWDMIHTWAGVGFIGAAVVHFGIHWRWIKNTTKRLTLSMRSKPALVEAPAQATIRLSAQQH